jgi:hypothetical protein
MVRNSAAAAALAAGLWATAAAAQVIDLGKYPDWSMQWQRVPDGGVPRYDPSKPIYKQEAPLKPEYQAMWEASVKDIQVGGFGLDTHYACMPMAMPRQMSGVSLMEFIIMPDVTRIVYEDSTAQTRRIYTDGRDFPKDDEPSFMGYSIGKWLDEDKDGRFDTLEVETRNFKGPRTVEFSGIPLAEDNETVVKERISLDKADKDIMHNVITIIDNAFTHPWTVDKRYRRDRNVHWFEDNCNENNHHIVVGKDNYFVSGDGFLMPTRKDQKPPDLRYFKPAAK